MSVLQALDVGLAFLVFAVAAWTVFAPGAFAATVGYVVYGLLLSLVWIRLFAVDVALTEAAIGSGVTGVLLIGAAARLRGAETTEAKEPLTGLARLFAACLCLLVAAALAAVVLLLPDQGPTLAPQSMERLPETGLGNPVTAVLIAFRSFDTMLEKVVLVLAVVGVWSLAADRYWGGAPGEARAERPEPTLAFFAQMLAPIGILVGVHVFWVGADEPGGAFQGGAILAAMWMIVMMARLTEAPQASAFWLRLALIAGPAVFLAAGVTGAVVAGGFFAYPPGLAKPLILFIETFMTFTIAVTLPMLVAGPPRRERPSDELGDAGRVGRGGACRSWPLWRDRRSAAAAQDSRVQSDRQRRFPRLRHRRKERRGSGTVRRSGSAGDGDHRDCRRLRGQRARGRIDAAPVRGDWPRDAAP